MSDKVEVQTSADEFHKHCVTALEFIGKQNLILDAKIAELMKHRRENDQKLAALTLVKNKCYLMVNSWIEPSNLSI